MKKAQLSQTAELDLGDTGDFIASVPYKFTGTDNPRHLRVLRALLVCKRSRKEIDRIAGASNGPALMGWLRRHGLISLEAKKEHSIDRDGRAVTFGIYEFDDHDRHAVNVFFLLRDAKGKA